MRADRVGEREQPEAMADRAFQTLHKKGVLPAVISTKKKLKNP